ATNRAEFRRSTESSRERLGFRGGGYSSPRGSAVESRHRRLDPLVRPGERGVGGVLDDRIDGFALLSGERGEDVRREIERERATVRGRDADAQARNLVGVQGFDDRLHAAVS